MTPDEKRLIAWLLVGIAVCLVVAWCPPPTTA